MDSYWIGFFDADGKEHTGKIRLICTAWEDMCSYNFNSFFDYSEIDMLADLELQEKLLERINWLIDEGIVKIDERR